MEGKKLRRRLSWREEEVGKDHRQDEPQGKQGYCLAAPDVVLFFVGVAAVVWLARERGLRGRDRIDTRLTLEVVTADTGDVIEDCLFGHLFMMTMGIVIATVVIIVVVLVLLLLLLISPL